MRSLTSKFVAGVSVALAAAGAVSVPTGAAGSWPMFRYDAAQTGFNPSEHRLNSHNVSKVKLLFTATLADTYGSGVPAVAGNLAFVESYALDGSPGRVEAFATDCAAEHYCSPLWSASIGRYSGRSVAAADGLVFAGGDNHASIPTARLYAFDQRCRSDGGACRPLWYADLAGPGELDAPPTVAGGVVYVPGGSPGRAFLYAFPEDCRVSPDTSCPPLWRGRMDLGDTYGSVAVTGGFAYVSDYDGYLFAFRTDCDSPTRVCGPAWLGYTNELGPSSAAVDHGLVFLGSQNDDLYAFRAYGCGPIIGLACAPVWVGATRGNLRSAPAVAYGTVFVASDDGYDYAFPEHCAETCLPEWKARAGGNDSFYADPFVAGGVVYFSNSDGPGGRAILAYGVHCASGGAMCAPITRITAPTYFLFEGPAVAGGRLYATAGPRSGPGKMYVFGSTPEN